MYASRLEWQQHELEEHKVEWSCNMKDHHAYQNQDDFITHMLEDHSSSISPEQLLSLLHSFQRPRGQKEGSCPLCLQIPRSIEGHVARHHKQLALFAIPRLQYAWDGSENESVLSKDALGHSSASMSSRNANLQKSLSSDNLLEAADAEFPEDITIESDKLFQAEVPDSLPFDYALLGPEHWLSSFPLNLRQSEDTNNDLPKSTLQEADNPLGPEPTPGVEQLSSASTLAEISAMIEVCERLGAYLKFIQMPPRRKDEDISLLAQQNSLLISTGSSVKIYSQTNDLRRLSLSSLDNVDKKWEGISSLIHEFHHVPDQLEGLLKEVWPVSSQSSDSLERRLLEHPRHKAKEFDQLRQKVSTYLRDIQLLLPTSDR